MDKAYHTLFGLEDIYNELKDTKENRKKKELLKPFYDHLEKALSKDKKERPQDIKELKNKLEDLIPCANKFDEFCKEN